MLAVPVMKLPTEVIVMRNKPELQVICAMLILIAIGLSPVISERMIPEAVSETPSGESEEVASSGDETTPAPRRIAEALTRSETAAPKPPPKPAHPEYPLKLSIQSIDVDAPVQVVGLAASGNIASPSGFHAVGWFVRSALPGQNGTSVYDGHVDNGLLRLGVFKHLDRVSAGDEVVIKTRGGKTLRYLVTRVAVYGYKNVPMADILAPKEGSELVLITCAGDWISAEKTYGKRLIVSATLTSP